MGDASLVALASRAGTYPRYQRDSQRHDILDSDSFAVIPAARTNHAIREVPGSMTIRLEVSPGSIYPYRHLLGIRGLSES